MALIKRLLDWALLGLMVVLAVLGLVAGALLAAACTGSPANPAPPPERRGPTSSVLDQVGAACDEHGSLVYKWATSGNPGGIAVAPLHPDCLQPPRSTP